MNIEELRVKFDKIQYHLSRMSEVFPWENKEAYASWLAQSFEYARFSTRILALTAGHFPLDKTSHSTRFIQHAAEEKGHEKMLINDAKALGLDIEKIPVLPEAEAFHKSLYFWIYQGRPSVILGWVLCLEGFAVKCAAKMYERSERAHGKKAATFLRVHAAEDADHVQKAFATIRELSAADISEVSHGLELYAKLYENIYASIVTHSKSETLQAA